jgi:hypothetical protein
VVICGTATSFGETECDLYASSGIIYGENGEYVGIQEAIEGDIPE